jgi:3-phosphoshikimate 1-carboxyvinyltransferase
VEYLDKEGYPPIRVDADGFVGGIVRFGRAKSSQFLSALLMVSPYGRHEVSVDLEGQQTSWPYVVMTMRLMDEFGITCELIRDPKTTEPTRIHVPGGVYKGHLCAIEPDASNATYFLAAAAIRPGASVKVLGLGNHSLQGDVGFAKVLGEMSAEVRYAADSIHVTGASPLHGVEVNLAEMPDTAQTLAVAALFAEGPTTIHGLGTLRVKETDRLAALVTELAKLGARATVEGDSLTINPPTEISPAAIDTYDDHRMAMSFAVAGTRAGGITIKDSECVSKTYPGFFQDLERVMRSS